MPDRVPPLHSTQTCGAVHAFEPEWANRLMFVTCDRGKKHPGRHESVDIIHDNMQMIIRWPVEPGEPAPVAEPSREDFAARMGHPGGHYG